MTEFEAFFFIATLTFVLVIIIEFIIGLFEAIKKGNDTNVGSNGGNKDEK